MEITEALRLLSIDDISKCNADYIKKIYRKRIKKCHPDNFEANGNCLSAEDIKLNIRELNEAFSLLKRELNKLKSKESIAQFYNEYKYDYSRVIYGLDDILNVYKNSEVFDSLGNKITKERLNKDDVIFTINVHLDINGEDILKVYNLKKVLNDTYTIGYDVYCNIGDTVQVRILDISKEVVFKSNRCVLHFNFSYLVNIFLVLDRKEEL